MAFENLRNSPPENQCFYNEYKISDTEEKLIFIVFLNEDGLGSSRILLFNELAQAFPKGYFMAMPDRSCGVIISKDIEESELEIAKQFVKEMFLDAEVQMSDSLFMADEFSLPTDWTKPIDLVLSSEIVEQIINYKNG